MSKKRIRPRGDGVQGVPAFPSAPYTSNHTHTTFSAMDEPETFAEPGSSPSVEQANSRISLLCTCVRNGQFTVFRPWILQKKRGSLLATRSLLDSRLLPAAPLKLSLRSTRLQGTLIFAGGVVSQSPCCSVLQNRAAPTTRASSVGGGLPASQHTCNTKSYCHPTLHAHRSDHLFIPPPTLSPSCFIIFRVENATACFQVRERAASMARLVDSLLRGRAQPSARNEAAAAVSDVRVFVRAWRPAVGPGTSEPAAIAPAAPAARASRARDGEGGSAVGADGRESGGEARGSTGRIAGGSVADRPSAEVLLELAQVRGDARASDPQERCTDMTRRATHARARGVHTQFSRLFHC